MKEQIINQIKSLSELELISVMEELAEYLRKEKMEHLITQCFIDSELEENVRELTSQLEDEESKNFNLTSERDKLQKKIYDIEEILNK